MSYYDEPDEKYNDICAKIENKLVNTKLTPIEPKDIQVGQTVYAQFLPYSQQYIGLLVPKIGQVQTVGYEKIYDAIDSKTYEFFKITIKNIDGQIEELFHPAVSYYSLSLGYDYIINLVEPK
jgi:hypothetical protein